MDDWLESVAEADREYRSTAEDDATSLVDAILSEQTLCGRLSATAGTVALLACDGTRIEGEVASAHRHDIVIRGAAHEWWLPARSLRTVTGLVAAAGPASTGAPVLETRDIGRSRLRSWLADDVIVDVTLEVRGGLAVAMVRGWLRSVASDHVDVVTVLGERLTVASDGIVWVRRAVPHARRRASGCSGP